MNVIRVQPVQIVLGVLCGLAATSLGWYIASLMNETSADPLKLLAQYVQVPATETGRVSNADPIRTYRDFNRYSPAESNDVKVHRLDDDRNTCYVVTWRDGASVSCVRKGSTEQ